MNITYHINNGMNKLLKFHTNIMYFTDLKVHFCEFEAVSNNCFYITYIPNGSIWIRSVIFSFVIRVHGYILTSGEKIIYCPLKDFIIHMFN